MRAPAFLQRRGIELPELALVLFLCGQALAETLTATSDQFDGPRWTAVVVMTLVPLPILVMRRRPTFTSLAVMGFVLSLHVFVADVTDLFAPNGTLIVSAFGAGAYAAAPRTYWLAALYPAAVTFVDVTSRQGQAAGDYVFPSFIFLTAWFVGRLVHGRAQVAQRLAEQTAQLERDRVELAHAAVARERSRIARELHDVVAHNVSVMVVQSGAARRVLPRAPEESVQALRTVQEIGREALTELRRTLGFLRPEGAAAERSPAPSLARLDELAGRARTTGLPVEVRREGEPWPLPASSDLAAYRIVQEALTNTLKHARGAHATVCLRWTPDALDLEVRDTGGGRAGPAERLPSAGQGLVGMRERAALAGGSFKAGPARGGGFRVRVRFPRDPSRDEPAPPSIPSQEVSTA